MFSYEIKNINMFIPNALGIITGIINIYFYNDIKNKLKNPSN